MLPARATADPMPADEQQRKRDSSDQRMARLESHVFVCNGGRCERLGATELLSRFRAELARLDNGRLRVTETKCIGRCVDSCSVVVYPAGVWYRNVTEAAVPAIVARHAGGGDADGLISFVLRDGHFVKSN